MPRICVTSISFSKNPILRAELLEIFPDTVFNESGKKMSEQDVIEFAQGFDAVIVGTEPISARVIDALPGMQVLAKYGVGLDNLDVVYLEKSGCELGWKPGINRRSVSELALMFLLTLSHNVHQTSRDLRHGRWNKDGGRLFSQCTVGIVGCGSIGEDLLGLLRPFGAVCLVADILDRSMVAARFGATQVSYETLLAQSDLVSFHVPLSASTRGMFSDPQIALMRRGSCLVNTSRGPVIDQAALKKALLRAAAGDPNSTLAAAGLDVFEEEPVSDMELLALPNLIGTPHIGGNTAEAVLAMGRAAIESISEYFASA